VIAAFRCELHVHSTYSDGSVSPEGLCQRAAQIGLAVLAITDHDNARGARVALPLADRYGLEVIPAIEFTSRWDSPWGPGTQAEADVLGYFIDLDHPLLLAREEASVADDFSRVADCCARLTAAGYPVTIDEVQAENPLFAGMRHLRDVLAKKGYAPSNWEAGKIANPVWESGRLARFSLAEQVQIIHAAGGVAVLAHPDFLHDGAPIQAEQVAALAEMGVDGLEVYHRMIDAPLVAHLQRLADQFGLLVTGGSDEHGWSPDLPHFGGQPVTREMIEALRKRHQTRVNT
jgi:hypothetical protein